MVPCLGLLMLRGSNLLNGCNTTARGINFLNRILLLKSRTEYVARVMKTIATNGIIILNPINTFCMCRGAPEKQKNLFMNVLEQNVFILIFNRWRRKSTSSMYQMCRWNCLRKSWRKFSHLKVCFAFIILLIIIIC